MRTKFGGRFAIYLHVQLALGDNVVSRLEARKYNAAVEWHGQPRIIKAPSLRVEEKKLSASDITFAVN